MKSAIPIASGVATSSAMIAASSVPNSSGQMYATRLLWPGRSAELAFSAGMDCTIRKTATPASTARMRMPAAVAPPENNRSPSRRTERLGGAGCVVGVTPAPRGCGWSSSWCLPPVRVPERPGASEDARAIAGCPESLGGDRVHRLLVLLPDGVRDGRGARLLGRRLLTVRADHVAQEGLEQVGLVRGVLEAADVVTDQDDRVLVGRGGRPVDVQRVVVLAAPGLHLRRLHDGSRGLGRGCDVVGADLDLRDPEALGLALRDVADRPLAGVQGADHARGLRTGLPALDRPVPRGRGGPHAGCGLRQVV